MAAAGVLGLGVLEPCVLELCVVAAGVVAAIAAADAADWRVLPLRVDTAGATAQAGQPGARAAGLSGW